MADRAGAGPRRLWWASFGLLSVLGVLWALAMPLFSSPDEQAHQLRAASLARGELLGTRVDKDNFPFSRVTAPISLQIGGITCFAFRPEVTADCQEPVTDDAGDQRANTYVGHYPPTYSLPVGLAGRVAGDRQEARLQRVASALLSAALLASAVVSLRSWRGGPRAGAFVLALTPMTLFLSGTVNPNGIETAAALALWASALPLLADPSGATGRLLVRTVVAAGALALLRPLSPLWVAVIGMVVIVATPWPALRSALTDRRVLAGAAAVVAAGVAALGWISYADALRVIPSSDPERPTSYAAAVEGSLSQQVEQLPRLVGNFGWLDNPVPEVTGWVWLAGVTVLVMVAVAFGTGRRALATVVCLVLLLAVPVALEASQAGEIGYVWQARYSLPLFVGIPLLAAWALEQRPASARRRRAEVALVGIALAAHGYAFVDAMARYTVGGGNGLGLVDPVWSPVLPPLLLAGLYALLLAALAVVLLRAFARPSDEELELVDGEHPEHRSSFLV